MGITRQTTHTGQTSSGAERSGAAAEGNVQLKNSLRGMSYAEGMAALSPDVQMQQAVQKEEEDPNVAELKEKVGRLVDSNHGGDYGAAFDHYAGSDAQANRSEIIRMLADAGVGNGLTRGMWADGIMEKVDTSGDGKVSRTEFTSMLEG